MLTSCVQRWVARRASYRPMGEPIQTREYEVAALSRDTIAWAFMPGGTMLATHDAE